MKFLSVKKLFLIEVLLVLCQTASVWGFFGKTLILPRSQTVNAAREIAGWQEHINDYDVGRTYWSFYMAPEYQRSWNNGQISRFLFGCSDCFAVQGSRVADRRTDALLADYFGLPSDFESTVSVSPQITQFVWDMNFYVGLDGLCQGLYFRFHAPVVYAKWDLNLKECVQEAGTDFYPAGYMGSQLIPRNQLVANFTEAMTGQFCNRYKQCGPYTWGDMENGMQYGLIYGRRNESRLSDVHIIVGYNFFNNEDYHGGLNLRISAPAGNRPNCHYFFEPIVGNGHHWEIGAGWTSHIIFWSSADELDYAGFWCDINVTHLFADSQLRSFDFCGNPGSRYMLLSKLTSVTDPDVLVAGEPITKQYIGNLSPAINQTTLDAKISMKAQVDMVAKFSVELNGVQFDLGYNFWYRSPEHLVERACFKSGYALKGDAQVYGFVSQDSAGFTLNQALPLNVTQHEATLSSGQGDGNFVTGSEFINANADNPGLASDSNTNILYQLNQADAAALSIAQQQINGSNGPLLLTDANIDIDSALNPHAISHKIFGNVAYTWESPRVAYAPFLACGSELEWRCGCFKSNSAISQWGIWAKGGLSF